MDDKQLAMLLTAMSDQTAAMNRMADAMTGILLHLDPKQAAKFAAPGYMRPLAAYASFDWNSIDAHVIAFDRHGATEVEHNGVAYRRYRSNDDDPKGVDIRFRRVVSGTPEGKDMIWATLIKFADKKLKDAPRPLRGELAEKIEQAQQTGAQSASTTETASQVAPTPTSAPASQPPAQAAKQSALIPPPATPSKSSAWQDAGIGPAASAVSLEPPQTATLTGISEVNRTAVSSLLNWLNDPKYFHDPALGKARQIAAATSARDQLIARGMDSDVIKAGLKEQKTIPFLRAAVDAMIEHDLKAPVLEAQPA